jgi:rubrerythrin
MITLAEVIERAAGLETQLREVYESFAELFSAEPEAASFWQEMAEGERVHASQLVETLSAYSPERLAEQADLKLVSAVDGVEEAVREARGVPVVTLDDAYEVAHMLESSEINTVFGLLVAMPSDTQSVSTLVAAQFDEHLAGLAEFGKSFDREARKSCKADE